MKSTFTMEQQQDYIRDLSEIRSMMERSTKFLSLSGWAGIMAGVYALIGAYLAHYVFGFTNEEYNKGTGTHSQYAGNLNEILLLGFVVLVLAIGTAAVLSGRKAQKRNEKLWNATSRRLMFNMSVPLIAGGLFVLILISKGLIGLVAPVTLIFYGFSLYIAGRYTYEDVKVLGLIQIALGLAGAWFLGLGLLFWALGFGVGHIIYGIYVHYKYER